MPEAINDSVECGNCGHVFQGDDLDQESGKRKPCPQCGSLKRNFNKKVEVKIGVKVGVSGVHEAHMSPQSWAIFGLILAFFIPPIFYAVFSILTIGFWYKFLIWLGIIFIPVFLAYKYRIIWYKIITFLRLIADKTYGKNKI